MTIVSIGITDAMRAEAEKLAAKVAKTKTVTTRDNYTGLNMPGRYVSGFIGEFAVRQWFEDNAVRYVYHCRQDGRSDSGDFDVYRRGLLLRLDAKTRSKQTDDMLMMPEAQFQSKRRDIYVGVRLAADRRQAEIMGWQKLPEVWQWPVRQFKVLTRCQEFRFLEDSLELLDELDRR